MIRRRSTHVLRSFPLSLRDRVGVRACSQRLPRQKPAFTLIETMLAVLIMALLASAAALSFAAPLRAARAREAIDQLTAADRAARQESQDAARSIRLAFDPFANSISRFAGRRLQSQAILPPAYRIEDVFIGRRVFRSSQVDVDFSTSGYGPSYAVHLMGPGLDRWIIFAGLTGQTNVVSDEQTVRSALENVASPARHDAD